MHLFTEKIEGERKIGNKKTKPKKAPCLMAKALYSVSSDSNMHIAYRVLTSSDYVSHLHNTHGLVHTVSLMVPSWFIRLWYILSHVVHSKKGNTSIS